MFGDRTEPSWIFAENSAAINFMLSAAVWLVIGVTLGMILALEFVFPDLFRGIPFLVFSRLRQAHVNTGRARQISMDGPLGNASPELEEFAADPVRTPPRVLCCHLLNQCDELWRKTRTTRATLELREEPESSAMPVQECIWLENQEGLLPKFEPTGEE